MTIEAANRTAQGVSAMHAARQSRDISVATGSAAGLTSVAAGSARSLTAGDQGVTREVRSLVRDIAASPSVNSAKVAELKAAIEAGAYKVEPERLADAMIRSELLQG